jgi:DNA polymerase III subunit delta'
MSVAAVAATAADGPTGQTDSVLPGIEAHPHARAVLGSALAGLGGGERTARAATPSHAYLLHGPAGAGKRALARAFAGELLAAGSTDAEAARRVRERVARGAHPDLTWVAPSGAAEMLVGDIDRDVVAASALTPFEAARRVFVIESAERLNEQAANRLLKTLEEPPAYVHVLLISDRPQEVMATIASRCVHVRFDAPATEAIARELLAEGVCAQEGEARACARLALGDAARARMLAGADGKALRAAAEAYVCAALEGEGARPGWPALLDAARAAGVGAGEEASRRLTESLELVPNRERKRLEREAQEAARRAERRARAQALDEGLQLAELWLRDLVCMQEGADELVHAIDRRERLAHDAERASRARARKGMERVRETRTRLQVNVGEELALEALAYRLRDASA